MSNNKTVIAIVAALVVIVICLVCTAAGLMLYLTSRNNLPVDSSPGAGSVQTPVTVGEPDEEPVTPWSVESALMSKKTATADVKLNYPQIKNLEDASTQSDFNDLVRVDMQAIMDATLAMPDNGMSIPNSSSLDFAVAFKSDQLLSIASQGSDYGGGAHPNALIYTITYDLNKAKRLELGDLFKPGSSYLTQIADYCIAELKTRGISDDATITGGASAAKKNYQYFDIVSGATELEIIFPPYQVAAYAAGTQIVSVPTSVFASSLKPEYASVFK